MFDEGFNIGVFDSAHFDAEPQDSTKGPAASGSFATGFPYGVGDMTMPGGLGMP